MTALHLKLFRDLRRLSGQVVTIALVVASGIASDIALRGNYGSLERARDSFYEHQRFADVFASLERAPASLRSELESIPAVDRAETRIVQPAILPLEDASEPVRARLVSLPGDALEAMNAVRVHDGRRPEAGHAEEVVLLHAFAAARGIEPGDRIPAIVNGTRRELRVVGTATSPEYVLAIGAGSVTADPDRFAVVWMASEALAAAFRMEGAFNDVALSLAPGASEPAVIGSVDRVLAPYGGTGAYGRDRQPSNHVLEGELKQLQGMATTLPVIFLAVAALLVNVVLSRLVHLQRSEIATLKAVGYSDLEVGLHFLELVLVVGFAGAGLGLGLGAFLGTQILGLYEQFFKLPGLEFRIESEGAAFAVAASFGAAAVGALSAVRTVVRLAPAEAMQPAAPLRYRRSLLDRLGIAALVGPTANMVARELERRPLRSLLSSLAIAASTGLSVVGGWYYDGIDALVETQFHEVMREDVAVTFMRPLPERAVRELAHLPGVLAAEGLRAVPVRFRVGHRHRDGVVLGYPDGGQMRSLRDRQAAPIPLPPNGIVLTDILASVLDVRVGDTVALDVREGARQTREVVVAGLVDESFGLQGHMVGRALDGLLGGEAVVSMALLRTDPAMDSELDARLRDLPALADVTRRSRIVQRFREQSANMIHTTAAIVALFAATITVGVVYNNARVTISLRGRDLASLRVLGFTRGEISSVLLGELAVQVLVALPLGLLFGQYLVAALASTVDPETYRLPLLLTPRSYSFAALVTLIAAIVSALLARRRLDQLDLIAVLKTRD